MGTIKPNFNPPEDYFNDLEKKLKEIPSQYPKAKSKPLYLWVGIAASILLFITVGIMLNQQINDLKNQGITIDEPSEEIWYPGAFEYDLLEYSEAELELALAVVEEEIWSEIDPTEESYYLNNINYETIIN